MAMRQSPYLTFLILLSLLPAAFSAQGAGSDATQQTEENLLLPPRIGQVGSLDEATSDVKPTSATMKVSDIAHLFRAGPLLQVKAPDDTVTTQSAETNIRITTPPLRVLPLPPPGAIRGGKVWINEATAEELIEVLQIDYQRARNVVKYRDLFGPFNSIDDLRHVTGFHDAMIKLLRDKMVVAPPATKIIKRERLILSERLSVPELSVYEKQKARNERTHVHSSELS